MAMFDCLEVEDSGFGNMTLDYSAARYLSLQPIKHHAFDYRRPYPGKHGDSVWAFIANCGIEGSSLCRARVMRVGDDFADAAARLMKYDTST